MPFTNPQEHRTMARLASLITLHPELPPDSQLQILINPLINSFLLKSYLVAGVCSAGA